MAGRRFKSPSSLGRLGEVYCLCPAGAFCVRCPRRTDQTQVVKRRLTPKSLSRGVVGDAPEPQTAVLESFSGNPPRARQPAHELSAKVAQARRRRPGRGCDVGDAAAAMGVWEPGGMPYFRCAELAAQFVGLSKNKLPGSDATLGRSCELACEETGTPAVGAPSERLPEPQRGGGAGGGVAGARERARERKAGERPGARRAHGEGGGEGGGEVDWAERRLPSAPRAQAGRETTRGNGEETRKTGKSWGAT